MAFVDSEGKNSKNLDYDLDFTPEIDENLALIVEFGKKASYNFILEKETKKDRKSFAGIY